MAGGRRYRHRLCRAYRHVYRLIWHNSQLHSCSRLVTAEHATIVVRRQHNGRLSLS